MYHPSIFRPFCPLEFSPIHRIVEDKRRWKLIPIVAGEAKFNFPQGATVSKDYCEGWIDR